jgi:hypothetical protein
MTLHKGGRGADLKEITMTTATQSIFGGTIQKTEEWLHELMRELDWDDAQRAYAGLRAVLHTLRADR